MELSVFSFSLYTEPRQKLFSFCREDYIRVHLWNMLNFETWNLGQEFLIQHPILLRPKFCHLYTTHLQVPENPGFRIPELWALNKHSQVCVHENAFDHVYPSRHMLSGQSPALMFIYLAELCILVIYSLQVFTFTASSTFFTNTCWNTLSRISIRSIYERVCQPISYHIAGDEIYSFII